MKKFLLFSLLLLLSDCTHLYKMYEKANETGKTKKSFANQSESNSSWYAVVISNIQPEYQPLTLEFELHYRGSIESYKVVLKPKYWEEHRNNFYDGIMSV